VAFLRDPDGNRVEGCATTQLDFRVPANLLNAIRQNTGAIASRYRDGMFE
jgi:hypothetical protein